MRLAIEKAAEGVAQGQWPYGACLVKQDEVVACVHNVTRAYMDPTGHAETHALREACLKLNALDLPHVLCRLPYRRSLDHRVWRQPGGFSIWRRKEPCRHRR